MHRGGSRGVDRPDAKLDDSLVLELRRLRSLPRHMRPRLSELRARYGVSASTLSRATNARSNRASWKHVKEQGHE